MNLDNVEAIDGACICQSCSPKVFDYLTTDPSILLKVFTEHDDVTLRAGTGTSGELLQLFLPANSAEGKSQPRPWGKVLRIISLSGSGCSVVCLISVIVHKVWDGNVKSGGRRCQLAMFVAKLLFFTSMGCGTLFRQFPIVCQFFSVTTHYAMLVSFGQMVWFGLKVAHLLWQLNHNMAALTVENQRHAINHKEVATFLVIWLGTFFLVFSLWAYDFFVDNTFFQYGKNEMCILTGKNGKLYFVVIPTTMMVILNFGSTIFAVIQYGQTMNQLIDRNAFLKLLKFLSKLVVLQSIQWVFGIVFYFTSSTWSMIVFEVFVVFEGVHMAISYFNDKLRKAKTPNNQ